VTLAPDWLLARAGVPVREALERTGMSVLMADATGNITVVSAAMRELFGMGEQDADGLTIDDPRPHLGPVFADGTPMQGHQTPLGRALGGEFVRDFLLGAHDAAGRLIWLECNAMPLRDADGSPAGGVVLMLDVTDRVEGEAVTAALHRELLDTVEREFRGPLATLVGNLEVIGDLHGDEVPDDLARSLGAIERATWRLCHLVGAAASLMEKQEELHRNGRQPDGAPRRTA
jgi:PAS domain S-box-containing protein